MKISKSGVEVNGNRYSSLFLGILAGLALATRLRDE